MRFIVQRLAALLAVLCCGLLAGGVLDASQNAPRAQFDNLEEQFKYGSVGIESEEGFPYWLWQALPRVFADKLPRPGGYDSFGFVWEPGRELPVGFSTADLFGGPRIAVNCASMSFGSCSAGPPFIPEPTMLRNERTRVFDVSMMLVLNWRKFRQPAPPASTRVVWPLRNEWLSGSTADSPLLK